jgi:hypothetical protein
MKDRSIPLPKWCQPDMRVPVDYRINRETWGKPPRRAEIFEKEKRRVRDAA